MTQLLADVSSPKDWLPKLNPGFGPSTSGTATGIGFLTERVVPFIVSGALFLVIFLSVIFTIIGGIMYMISGGNKEGMAKAKNTITYALIGLALGLMSLVIMAVLGQIFNFSLYS